jgi:hypothetical protein
MMIRGSHRSSDLVLAEAFSLPLPFVTIAQAVALVTPDARFRKATS